QELEALGLRICDGKYLNLKDRKLNNGKVVNDEEFYYYWVPANRYFISKSTINLTIKEQPYNLKKYRRKRGFKKWGLTQKYTCGVCKLSICQDCRKFYVVRVPCKREYCPECGVKHSLAHKQLTMKLYIYMLELYEEKKSIGYFVITAPPELRELLKSKEERQKFRRYIIRLFKREGFGRGVTRWHFAGDKSKKWYPHLNVLVSASYLEKEKLERIKRLIERRYGVKTVFYEYLKDLPRIYFVAEYVARPTFLMQDEVGAESIKGSRRVQTWGCFKVNKMNEKTKEEFEQHIRELMIKGYLENEVEKMAYCLLSSRCPTCYEKLSWQVRKYFDLPEGNIYKLGWGCWIIDLNKIENIPPPEEDDEYWEPGMGDADYITEEDKKLIEEKQRKEGGNEFI
ncbi:MAG: hypothetical protein ACO2PO_23475, partial [Candidatus Calescibacterium sp.]